MGLAHAAQRTAASSRARTRPRRKLLARVCLVREEIQNAAREAAFNSGREWRPADDEAAKLRGGVSRRAVAFLQVERFLASEFRMWMQSTTPRSSWVGGVSRCSAACLQAPGRSSSVCFKVARGCSPRGGCSCHDSVLPHVPRAFAHQRDDHELLGAARTPLVKRCRRLLSTRCPAACRRR